MKGGMAGSLFITRVLSMTAGKPRLGKQFPTLGFEPKGLAKNRKYELEVNTTGGSRHEASKKMKNLEPMPTAAKIKLDEV